RCRTDRSTTCGPGDIRRIHPLTGDVMSLNKYHGIGRIASIDHKPVPNNTNGLTICRISVPINIWTPGKNGQDGTEETMWVELTAFGSPDDKFNQAENWANKFQKGDVVAVSGTPKLRAFLKKNR